MHILDTANLHCTSELRSLGRVACKEVLDDLLVGCPEIGLQAKEQSNQGVLIWLSFLVARVATCAVGMKLASLFTSFDRSMIRLKLDGGVSHATEQSQVCRILEAQACNDQE